MGWKDVFVHRDGDLYWKQPGMGRQVDKPAGTVGKDSYRVIEVDGKKHRAHRIVWEMHHGPIPDGLVVDHRDADR